MSATARRTEETGDGEGEVSPPEETERRAPEMTPRDITLARAHSPWDRAKRWLRDRLARVA